MASIRYYYLMDQEIAKFLKFHPYKKNVSLPSPLISHPIHLVAYSMKMVFQILADRVLLLLIKMVTLFHLTSSFPFFGESVTLNQFNFSGFSVAHTDNMSSRLPIRTPNLFTRINASAISKKVSSFSSKVFIT